MSNNTKTKGQRRAEDRRILRSSEKQCLEQMWRHGLFGQMKRNTMIGRMARRSYGDGKTRV